MPVRTVYNRPLTVHRTTIPGLLLVDLPVHGDNRGWFKENWQRVKMTAQGLPDFVPVQNNISFNASRGTTRGIHAEPWDKYVSLGAGSIFGAWVDLREGPSYGTVFTATLGPDQAVFVPRGVGNSFQALTDDTVYSYLVNDHWSADSVADYCFVNLADPVLAIDWPIPLQQAELSEKDHNHPMLADAATMRPKDVVILCAETDEVYSSLARRLPSVLRRTAGSPSSSAWSDCSAIIFLEPNHATAAELWSDALPVLTDLVAIAGQKRLPLISVLNDGSAIATLPRNVLEAGRACATALMSTVPTHRAFQRSSADPDQTADTIAGLLVETGAAPDLSTRKGS